MINLSIPPLVITPQARAASAPALPVAAPPVPQPQPSTPELNANYEAAVKVSQAAGDQAYVISDKKFAIFKDASGQFITRYVSLIDGSVSYEPAPSFVKSTLPPISLKV